MYRAHKVRNSPRAHMMTYVLPSVIISVILNVPKFFETKLITTVIEDSSNTSHAVVNFEVTDIR